MTQEDKLLLVRDLCARLPYRVKAQCQPDIYSYDSNPHVTDVELIGYELGGFGYGKGIYCAVDRIRPYLFPMSAMTKEQKDEKNGLYYIDDVIDWLNAHHFDYRGLIEKGLAIDATGLNIY